MVCVKHKTPADAAEAVGSMYEVGESVDVCLAGVRRWESKQSQNRIIASLSGRTWITVSRWPYEVASTFGEEIPNQF